jgi:hypothetical protein
MDSPMKFELVNPAATDITELLGICLDRGEEIYNGVRKIFQEVIGDTAVIVNETYIHSRISGIVHTPQELVIGMHYAKTISRKIGFEISGPFINSQQRLTPLKVADSKAGDLSETLGISLERRQTLMFLIKIIFQEIALSGGKYYITEEIQRIRAQCRTEEEYTWILSIFIANVHKMSDGKGFTIG